MTHDMPQSPTPSEGALPRDAGHWAPATGPLSMAGEADPAGYNIVGRKVTGPQQGFGRMWQRTYWLDLGPAVTPAALIADWRAHFVEFWPKGSTFHGRLTGIEPGDVSPLVLGPAHGPNLATGILVLYADDESFTFMTPEGHMFAGLITFSGEAVDGGARAQIRILIRTSDPLFELGWPVLRRGEDVMWRGVLRTVAARHGVTGGEIHDETQCLDPRRQWKNAGNIRHNALIGSVLHMVTAPFRGTSR